MTYIDAMMDTHSIGGVTKLVGPYMAPAPGDSDGVCRRQVSSLSRSSRTPDARSW